MNYTKIALIFVATLTFAASSIGQDIPVIATKKRISLSVEEEKVVAKCLDIIRGCQLTDGGFIQVNEGNQAGSPVWIAPYFVSYSATALLVANETKKNPDDIARVDKWLTWCVAKQDAGGYWQDYTGTISTYQSNNRVDAHDSSAAVFLMVVERYQRNGGKISDKIRAAAKLSLKCIQNVTDLDGLTWAKPDYKVKYLMDNIEVYAGLVAARDLFVATGDPVESKAAGDQAVLVGKGLKRYWQAVDKHRYAWALHPNGTFDGGFDKLYPHGLAQLFGVAYVTPDRDPFQAAVKTFKPQTSREAIGAERYLIAASRLGGQEEKTWRASTVEAANAFTPKNVYMFRPGLVILGLLGGADWMPSVANSK